MASNPAWQLKMGQWIAQGPAPTNGGQVEGIANNLVVGAVHTVIAHLSNPNILYVGATNGGIWRTTNATANNPTWQPLTDNQLGNSIGAMAFDPTDATNQTIIVGIGRFSSFYREGSPLTGLLLTTDGGNTFTQINDPLLRDRNFSGVARRGNLILASANSFAGFGSGVFRSIDNGTTWNFVSGSNGLPNGAALDLTGDPTNLNRFYVSVQGIGIFRSDDGGANWVNISVGDVALNNVITDVGNNNAEMSVANNGRLYIGVLNSGQPAYIGFTDNQGTGWTAMDLPQTPEPVNSVTTNVGISPRPKPGGSGNIHFSIIADPNNPNIVYIGGDRQGAPGRANTTFPTFIGANDFTGRLFRGNTTVNPTVSVPSLQWEHLTHRNNITQIPGGGTANNSAPHADSREMVFDANGNLIEVDDGGIYRRTNPQNNAGDWFSLIGNLQVTELHNIAYDTVSNIIIGGAQDTGTPQQTASGSLTWNSVSTSDGGNVAVDIISQPGFSTRYSSRQNFQNFQREVYDNNNTRQSTTTVPLTVIGAGGKTLTSANFDEPQFVQPFELNAIDPTHILIGTNFLYESTDQGDNLISLGGLNDLNSNTVDDDRDGSTDEGDEFTPNGTIGTVTAIAYGGRLNGNPNTDLAYVASITGIRVRTARNAGDLTDFNTTSYGNSTPRDIVLNPEDWQSAFIVNENNQVFQTSNTGTTWVDITGNLQIFATNLGLNASDLNLRTIDFVATPKFNGIVVGTNIGIFSAISTDFTEWLRLGTDLPNVPVWDMDYDAQDNLLVAGTLGRGAWTFSNVREQLTIGVTKNGSDKDDHLIGTLRNDTLNGFNGQDTLQGRAGDDVLDGGEGSDTLDGGLGDDLMRGGQGNDSYYVDSSNDTIVENINEGTDTVKSSISYTLDQNLENLTLIGNDAINGTGNNLGNIITGNNASNTLNGEDGNDVLIGGVGADLLNGGNGSDTASYLTATTGLTASLIASQNNTGHAQGDVYLSIENLEGSEFSDRLFGNNQSNTLIGLGGDDFLDGNGGNDTLIGGKDNDTYKVYSIGDIVSEYANEGVDTVNVAISYTLGLNLENLNLLEGTTAINGTGNELNNIISGNSANNTLNGGDGNDKLIGGAGTDILNGGNGSDTASYITAITRVTASLSASENNTGDAQGDVYQSIENLEGSEFGDSLFGDNQSNTLIGLGGDDFLDGFAGNDTLIGGKGNDNYKIYSTGDVIVEYTNEGIDIVNSAINYILGANLENLNLLEGTAALNGTGNELGNIINGNSANNIIDGGAGNDNLYGFVGSDTIFGGEGNDWIVGGTGNDILTGGNGNDSFVYNSITDAGDMIKDFTVSSDKIVLTEIVNSSGFRGFNPLNDGFFSFRQASSGMTTMLIDPDGAAGNSFRPAPFILFNNVSATALNNSNNFVF